MPHMGNKYMMSFMRDDLVLSPVFLAHAPPGGSVQWEANDEFERSLQEMVQAAHAAWPDLPLPAHEFVRYLAEHLAADDVGMEAALRFDLDPELAYLKDHYRGLIEDAFREALAALPDKHINLLRLCFVDGLTQTQIGAMFRVNRSTVMRRLESVRETI